jgi:hypothetical protein
MIRALKGPYISCRTPSGPRFIVHQYPWVAPTDIIVLPLSGEAENAYFNAYASLPSPWTGREQASPVHGGPQGGKRYSWRIAFYFRPTLALGKRASAGAMRLPMYRKSLVSRTLVF